MEAEDSDADYDMTSPQDPITEPSPVAPEAPVVPSHDLLRNILAQSSQQQPQEKDIDLGSVMTVSNLVSLLDDKDVVERLYSSLPDGLSLIILIRVLGAEHSASEIKDIVRSSQFSGTLRSLRYKRFEV
jgi:hypothetical protein